VRLPVTRRTGGTPMMYEIDHRHMSPSPAAFEALPLFGIRHPTLV